LFLTTQDTSYISQTVIDGDQDGHVVEFNGVEDSTTVLSGFIIKGGFTSYGGGIYCSYSSPSLNNIIITDNHTHYGGGIYCNTNSNPILMNVTIMNNSAWSGGGIYCRYCNISLDNVNISYNSATGEYGQGGGIHLEMSDPSLDHVQIIGNSAWNGGGISCTFNSNTNFEDVVITDNDARYGGGIYCFNNSNPTLIHTTIRENYADNGGGIYCYNSMPTFSSDNRCNIYLNDMSNSRGFGSDIFAIECDPINIIVDTFTVLIPTDYYASPIDNYTYDINHGIKDSLINSDLYVAVDGNNSNTGLNPDDPLQTIEYALSIIYADSIYNNTIYLAPGIYSATTNGECFPIEWNNYVTLEGDSDSVTILNADSLNRVFIFNCVYDCMIKNITIKNGRATGSIPDNKGGGIYCNHSSPTFKNITLKNNFAELSGGGIYCENSNPHLENVRIIGNSTNNYGGGIYAHNSSNPILKNVTISNNYTVYTGGGVCCWESNFILINVTITDNYAQDGGGIYCEWSSDLNLVNCIIWSNSNEEIYISSGSVTATYSDIEGGWTGEGNIDADPLFFDPASNDYHLSWVNYPIPDSTKSPCIDAGDPSSPLDPDGTIADMGAFYFNQGVSIDEPGHNSSDIIWNFPNPTKTSTTIKYSLKQNSHVTISVYNLKGQLVETIINETKLKGEHAVLYNTEALHSGVYFYQIQSNDMSEIRKMIIIK